MGSYYYLTPVMGEGGGVVKHPLGTTPQLVGRSERAGIVLREPTVSRQHARIEVKEGAVHLEDLGSKHGTFVNSRRVQTTKLKPGDLIVFGLTVVLRLEESEQILAPSGFGASDPTVHVDDEPSMTMTQRDLLRRMPVSPVDSSVDELMPLADHALRLTRLGGLCMELLPGLYGRLGQLSSTLDDDDEPDMEAVRTTVSALLASATQLMQVAARIAPEPRPLLRLSEVVDRAEEQVRDDFRRRNITVSGRVPSDLRVRLDAEHMAAVLAGLLTNAGNQCPEGTAVEVVGRQEPGGVVIKIVDQGYGYPEEVLAQAFHPLGSDLSDPAAIRLWEARRAVVAMGGMLTVKSNEGVGAVVRIVLPVEHGH